MSVADLLVLLGTVMVLAAILHRRVA